MTTEEQPDPVSAFLERAAPLREQHDDFDEVVDTPVFTPAMRDAIFDSDHGPEIAYSLGKNTAEADRIAGLSASAVNQEIGRLEGEVAREKTADWMEEERNRQLEKIRRGGW